MHRWFGLLLRRHQLRLSVSHYAHRHQRMRRMLAQHCVRLGQFHGQSQLPGNSHLLFDQVCSWVNWAVQLALQLAQSSTLGRQTGCRFAFCCPMMGRFGLRHPLGCELKQGQVDLGRLLPRAWQSLMLLHFVQKEPVGP